MKELRSGIAGTKTIIDRAVKLVPKHRVRDHASIGLKIVRAMHEVTKTETKGVFAKSLQAVSLVETVVREVGLSKDPCQRIADEMKLEPCQSIMLLQVLLPVLEREFAWEKVRQDNPSARNTLRLGTKNGEHVLISTYVDYQGDSAFELPWFRSSSLTVESLLDYIWETPHIFCQFSYSMYGGQLKTRSIATSPDPICGTSALSHFHEMCDILNREPTGTMFIGRPGTGKTQCILHAASTLGKRVLNVQVNHGISSDTKLIDVFEELRPDILFLDDVDHVQKDGLFQLIDNLRKLPVHLVMAANKPEVLDEAIWRPGRIEHLFDFPLPDEEERRGILKGYAEVYKVDVPDSFVEKSDGYSGAFLKEMARRLQFEKPERILYQLDLLSKMRPKPAAAVAVADSVPVPPNTH